jgi:hypothetical protein
MKGLGKWSADGSYVRRILPIPRINPLYHTKFQAPHVRKTKVAELKYVDSAVLLRLGGQSGPRRPRWCILKARICRLCMLTTYNCKKNMHDQPCLVPAQLLL